jgi:2-dehydro-3-deoxygalactonokinase
MALSSFVAADWGTSSLRVWAMRPGGEVVAERRSQEGMQSVAPGGFPAVLAAHVAAFREAGSIAEAAPVVLCGMVGARQGWREAPYRDVPASPAEIVAEAIEVDRDVRILPGLARRDGARPDVMRGEETQLLGLLLDDPAFEGVVAMPGTHSKWVTIAKGRVVDFATVMTGELFALLSGQSIIRHSIGEAKPSGDPDSTVFLAGLADGFDAPARVIERLFSLRPRGLLLGAGGGEIADRLSGMLIGAEVAVQLSERPAPVRLVASGTAARLYGRAIAEFGGTAVTVDADEAVRRGLAFAATQLWPAL